MAAFETANPDETYTPKNTVKSHQPRFATDKAFATSVTNNDLVLLNPKLTDYPGIKPAIVMLDCGASKCFIDDGYVCLNKFCTTPLVVNKNHVVMAHGRISVAARSCTLQLNMDGFAATIEFIVTNLQR